MKSFTDLAMAAIGRGDVIVGGATEILCDPPVRLWNGEGTIVLGGQSYLGIGDRALAQVSSSAVGGAAQGMSMSMSGVDPDVIPLLDAADLRGASVASRRLVFDSSGTILLDEHVFDRGRIDAVETDETIGEAAVIGIAVEGAARGLGRRGGRMRTDSDQRLIDPTDGGFRRVSYAGAKTLYWGGQRPATGASALPNSISSSAASGSVRNNAGAE
ncbi:hypothetical protein [Sphingomonas faeni]|uniref:hypothetical protein n=1 Tax=Sphingomonas faeni TaxID=185950 RepID=UPI003349E47F